MAAKPQAVISFSKLKGAATLIEHVFFGTKVSYLFNKFSSSVDATVLATVRLALQPFPIYASSHRQVKFGVCAYQSEYHVYFFVQFCCHVLFISVTTEIFYVSNVGELIACSEHCLSTRVTSTLLVSYIYSISLTCFRLITKDYSTIPRLSVS